MRLLVHEQEYSGHHFHYLAYILPSLAGLVDEVVVAITPTAARSVEYRKLLEPISGLVDIQPVLNVEDAGLGMKSRFRHLANLKDAVRRHRPDYVLVPSGDGVTTAMGLANLVGRGGLPGGVAAEVGIHYGHGLKDIGVGRRSKDLIYGFTQGLSSWRTIHYMSMTNHEWIRSLGGPLAGRADLMPHPVPASPRLDPGECRRRLGMPGDGRYIGLVAELDARKAIPELLAAFRSAAGPCDRLLLAGRLHGPFAELIEAEYRDLLGRRQLLLMNHYIDLETSDLAHGALDVVCTPYPRFGQLSSAMLHGIAAGKPVLANDFGWMSAMIRRFGFGWACDIHDPAAFASTIGQALDQAQVYRESEATRRLLEFHLPSNFAEKWLEGVRDAMGLPPSKTIKSWTWVLEALEPGVQPTLSSGSKTGPTMIGGAM